MSRGASTTDVDMETQASTILEALDNSMAIIAFEPDGTIRFANDNFLNAVGYRLGQIQGRHHRLFCDNEYAGSMAYANFWQALGKGQIQSGTFKRVRSDGREIYIEASYTPVKDRYGRVIEVVKFAQDVTDKALNSYKNQSKLDAIEKSMARIEFTPEGVILDANSNFFRATGYSLKEIRGKHHRMFCPPEIANSGEYIGFWNDLANGLSHAGVFHRKHKSGGDLWLEATYSPMTDESGRVIGVVKFAFDVTEKQRQSQTNNAVVTQTKQISQDITQQNDMARASSEENAESIQRLSRSVEAGIEMVGRLGKVASEIGGITKVISEIALQTNLLALNAAIEAARAGETGKGFAVVADEVRTLANRTSQQAQDIADMISQTQADVSSVSDNMQQSATQSRKSLESTNKALAALKALSGITGDLNTLMSSLK